MSRARKTAIAALVGVLAVAPFMPRGGQEPAMTPTADPSQQAEPNDSLTPGRVTPDMRREIDRVVAGGAGPVGARLAPDTLADRLVRCADLSGQRYCLHVGWTTRPEAEVRSRVAAAAGAELARPTARETTGDLSTLDLLRRTAALDEDARAEAERRELTTAARSVSKVEALRRTAKTRKDYPERGVVLKPRRVNQQIRTWWCGPATMQMIAWGWQGEKKRQKHWARRLNTTGDGTSVWDMVRVVNGATGYDRPSRAGEYIVLDISDWSYKRWLLLNMRHVVDYRAPLVLHPILLKRFYPYLDDDASGHFQVGRGYDKRGDKSAYLGFFEPWNQQRFDPSEPYIHRVQWRSAYRSYRANQAHPQQNIGV
jgi:hypothetical protein